MEWKCVQLMIVLNMVTWDLTEMWTENVSKYNIELKLCT